MTQNELNERLIFLGDGKGSHSELVIAICLLFHGLQLDDICDLQISDVYDAHWDVRTHIRKFNFAIHADLNGWLEEYLEYLGSHQASCMMEMLLPNHCCTTRLAEHLEDHGAIPEEVLALGMQCYAAYIDGFRLPIVVEDCRHERS